MNIELEWIYGDKDTTPMKCKLDKEGTRYSYAFSMNTKNITERWATEAFEEPIRYVMFNGSTFVPEIKAVARQLQQMYDKSDEVNTFVIDGKKAWFDKSTRVGLNNALSLSAGDTFDLWVGNTKLTLSKEKCKAILSAIEDYALQCYNVTQSHLAAIDKLSTVDAVVGFDITADYPETLNLKSYTD